VIDQPAPAISIAAQLNSTFGILQREVLGLANLGDGAIKFSADDVGRFGVIPTLSQSELHRPFESLATRPLRALPEELRQDDRRALDRHIFDCLGLTPDQREAVYAAVLKLVASRLEKARTLRP